MWYGILDWTLREIGWYYYYLYFTDEEAKPGEVK